MGRTILKPIVTAALLGAAALTLAACGSGGSDPKKPAVRAGSATITEGQIDRVLDQQRVAFSQQGRPFPSKGSSAYSDLRRQTAATLVEQHFLEVEAKRCGKPCAVSEKEITARLKAARNQAQLASDAKFDEFLAQHKLSVDDVRQQLRLAMLFGSTGQQGRFAAYLTRGVHESQAQAQTYYRTHLVQYRQPPQRVARHILVASRATAQKVRAQVTDANFAELARKYSTDSGSRAKGGSLGPASASNLTPELDKAVQKLKVGEISQPLHSQFGWHVFEVTQAPATVTPFAKVKSQIVAQELQRKQSEVIQAWLKRKRAEWKKMTRYIDSDLKPPAPKKPVTTTKTVTTKGATTTTKSGAGTKTSGRTTTKPAIP